MGSEMCIRDRCYNIKFANGIVQKHGSPVMEGDEEDWENVTAWFNVIKENNLYRLWYYSGLPLTEKN